MSISKRIEKQIQMLNVNRNTKDLMLEILTAESEGISGYKALYDAKITEYLKKLEKKGEKA